MIQCYVTTSLNRTLLQVPFLNLVSNIVQRAGQVDIRVGGNTQEDAVFVDSLPGGKMIMKYNATVESTVSNSFYVPAKLLVFV